MIAHPGTMIGKDETWGIIAVAGGQCLMEANLAQNSGAPGLVRRRGETWEGNTADPHPGALSLQA